MSLLQDVYNRLDAMDAKIATLATVQPVQTAPSGSTSAAAATAYHVNAAGPAIPGYQASAFVIQGMVWPPASQPVTHDIDVTALNAGPADLYKTYLTAIMPAPVVLVIPEPSGTALTVRLHFAELYYQSAGQRFLNVSVNGNVVLSRWDVFTAAGAAFKAVVVDFAVTADASGVAVRVEGAGNYYPLLCGAEVLTA
jgi:hypothetical protein